MDHALLAMRWIAAAAVEAVALVLPELTSLAAWFEHAERMI